MISDLTPLQMQVATRLLQMEQKRRPAKHRRTDGREPMGLLEWTMLNRVYLRKGRLFTLKDRPYLKGIYNNTARHGACMKASQLGLTEYLQSKAVHMNVERWGDVLYIMPTARSVSDFSRSRLNPAIDASPELSNMVVRGGGYSRGVDTVGLKQFGNAFIYLRGATVKDGKAEQLKSIPTDLNIYDELDEMDEEAIPIAKQRLNDSPIAEDFFNSTPTFFHYGIHEVWENSNQLDWHVPCPHCGVKQQLLIENCILEYDALDRPVVWHGMDEGRAWIACIKCGGEMDRGAEGEWVAAFPDRSLVCFHPTQLMAPRVPLIEIVVDLQDIKEKKKQETHNQRLGVPFSPKGGRLTFEDLDACRRDYLHGPMAEAGASMGVDVGSVLHVIIRARADGNGQRRQLFAGFVPEFSDVAKLMEQYEVLTCVVDEGPETREAKRFQKGQPSGKVWLCHYVTGESEAAHNQALRWDYEKSRVLAARTWSLDDMLSRFYDQSNTIPYMERDSMYYKHLTALLRVTITRKSDSKPFSIYINEGRDDHYAHAENYCMMAGQRPMGWGR
jgi:hypothetical protein